MSDMLKLAAAMDGMTAALNRLADLQDASETAPKKKPPAPEPDEDDEEPAPPPKKKKPAPEPDEDEEPELDYETDIMPLIPAMSKKHGPEVVKALLATFKGADKKPCTKGAQVLPKDHEALLAGLQKLAKKKPAPPVDEDDED